MIPEGADEIRRYSLGKVDPTRFPQLAQWRSNPRVNVLVSGAERRSLGNFDGGALIEHVMVGENEERANPQDNTHLHIDTFFNTHKVWLYLDDCRRRTTGGCAWTVEDVPWVNAPPCRIRLRPGPDRFF